MDSRTAEQAVLRAFAKHKPDRKKLPDVARTIAGARGRVERYMGMGAFKNGDTILDLGSAWCPLLFGLPDDVRYVGVDVNRPSIEIARDVFGDRGEFHWLDVAAPKYNDGGKVKASRVRLPFDDGTFDSVLCCSLFTHFTSIPAVTNYVAEIRRVLKPGGLLLSTWFRSPPNPRGGDDRRFAYLEGDIRIAIHDWHWLHDEGGTTKGHDDQWHVLTQS